MKERELFLDYAKGIGILSVIFVHTTSGIISNWFASFHMILFFLISGYFLQKQNEYQKSFKIIILKKARYMLIPYICFSILNMLDFKIAGATSMLPTLKRIFILQGDGGTWFLTCIFFSEVLYLFILKYVKNNTIQNCLFVFLLCLSFIKTNTYPVTFVIVCMRILRATFFLSIGYKLINFIKTHPFSYTLHILLLLLTIILSIQNGTHCRFVANGNGKYILLYFVNGLLGSILCFDFCKKIEKYQIKILNYFGKNTIAILGTNYILYNCCKYLNLSQYLSCILIIIFEIFLIQILNKYFGFMFGKNKDQ